MSEDRETPEAGAPVEESETSHTEVLAAVERATSTETANDGCEPAETDAGAAADASEDSSAEASREPESTDVEAVLEVDAVVESEVIESADGDTVAIEERQRQKECEELERRERAAEIDTQLDMAPVTEDEAQLAALAATQALPRSERLPMLDDLPSAASEAEAETAAAAQADARKADAKPNGAEDNPLSDLYSAAPIPPEPRGNRGAGVLVSVVAMIGFAVLGAGVLALALAPTLAPSQFVDGVVDAIVSWQFGGAVAAFVVAMVVLVLIFGKAGWWAYVLGGFFVGAAVWVAATLGAAVDAEGFGVILNEAPIEIMNTYGITFPAIGLGIAARETSIWFGSWIGHRGRRIKMRNAEELDEYEIAVAEASA